MDETIDCRRIEYGRPEVRNLRAPAGDMMAGRCLLPTVRNYDPDRGEDRSQRYHDRGHEMKSRRYAFPSEYQDSQEAGFQKERKDSFGGQCGSEHVADESRINSPVRSELEFHDDSRRHAHREADRIEGSPEPRGCFIDRFAPQEIHPLEIHEYDSHPYRQGRKQVMKHDGQRKLETGE